MNMKEKFTPEERKLLDEWAEKRARRASPNPAPTVSKEPAGPTRWRAFFSDYRDLSTGLLFQKGTGPESFSNMASDFEVVNAGFYDDLQRKLTAAKEANRGLLNCLTMARDRDYYQPGPPQWWVDLCNEWIDLCAAYATPETKEKVNEETKK